VRSEAFRWRSNAIFWATRCPFGRNVRYARIMGTIRYPRHVTREPGSVTLFITSRSFVRLRIFSAGRRWLLRCAPPCRADLNFVGRAAAATWKRINVEHPPACLMADYGIPAIRLLLAIRVIIVQRTRIVSGLMAMARLAAAMKLYREEICGSKLEGRKQPWYFTPAERQAI